MTDLVATVGLDQGWVAGLLLTLAEQHATVATAESLTGGLVTAVLTAVPGSSAVVRGGIVVYATDLKTSLAGVDAALLHSGGAVQPGVASELAEGARLRCGATWGIGLTGVAGPDPQDGVPPGEVHIAVVSAGQSLLRRVEIAGGRAEIRAGAVRAALEMLASALRCAGTTGA